MTIYIKSHKRKCLRCVLERENRRMKIPKIHTIADKKVKRKGETTTKKSSKDSMEKQIFVNDEKNEHKKKEPSEQMIFNNL